MRIVMHKDRRQASRRGLPVRRTSVESARRTRAFSVLGVVLTILAVRGAAAQQPVTTVILVRHAERAAEPAADPALTAEGSARAAALAEAVGAAGITAVFATQYVRTRQTAEPTAARLGLSVETLAAGGDLKAYAAGVAARIRSRHAGETVLVVGHSNTVPAVVEALGADPVPIATEEYDHMFIVQLRGDDVRMVRVRYGKPSAGAGES